MNKKKILISLKFMQRNKRVFEKERERRKETNQKLAANNFKQINSWQLQKLTSLHAKCIETWVWCFSNPSKTNFGPSNLGNNFVWHIMTCQKRICFVEQMAWETIRYVSWIMNIFSLLNKYSNTQVLILKRWITTYIVFKSNVKDSHTLLKKIDAFSAESINFSHIFQLWKWNAFSLISPYFSCFFHQHWKHYKIQI